MNERIKLPAQEWLGHDPEKGDIHGYTFEQMREFAELIVLECARIGELKEQGCSQYDPDTSVGWYMKEHFGIEETEDSACPLCGEDGGTPVAWWLVRTEHVDFEKPGCVGWRRGHKYMTLQQPRQWVGLTEQEAAEAAVRAEREACARLCEESNDIASSYGLAQAIRARSNK